MGQFPLTKTIVTLVKKVMVITSDASELSSARFSSDSARARGFPARLGSAREIFELACPENLSSNELNMKFRTNAFFIYYTFTFFV